MTPSSSKTLNSDISISSNEKNAKNTQFSGNQRPLQRNAQKHIFLSQRIKKGDNKGSKPITKNYVIPHHMYTIFCVVAFAKIVVLKIEN